MPCAAAATTAGTLPEDVFDRQPLVSDDLVFVCRARLDNRAELERMLGSGDTKAAADSTLLCDAYQRWGDECVHRITGDFAFVAWHPSAARLTAAVDHGGAARLFWASVPSGIAASGELAALLTHPDVSKAPDFTALARMLDAGIDRASTPYSAVRALPGGHWLRWSNAGVHIERWWKPDQKAGLVFQDPTGYAEHALTLLERAVAAQSRSVGGVSTSLSGGLDSGLVTAIAANRFASDGTPLTAYTSVPEPGLPLQTRANWEADDGPYARDVAARYPNIRHRLIHPAGRSSIDVMPALFDTERIPMKSVSNLSWIDTISRECVAAASPVILNGGVGNATISYSGAGALIELLWGRRFGAAIAHARAMSKAEGRPLWHMLASYSKQALLRRQAWRSPALSLNFVRADMRPSVDQRVGMFAEHGNSRARWLAFATTPKTTWSADLLAQRGADWRDPTGDRRLIEALLTFPLAAFTANGHSRGLARTLGQGLLPDSVRLRRTRGAQVPELPALIARDGVRYGAVLTAMQSSPACLELLNIAALHAALHRVVAGDLDAQAAAAFERAFGVGYFLLSLDRPGLVGPGA